ncbi:hypothetical protein BC829DRAFT_230181 [Chytridium lagenaria]|nr:hypothetical protein BC829DRAFT_230181 [Chytridium lagenaria]
MDKAKDFAKDSKSSQKLSNILKVSVTGEFDGTLLAGYDLDLYLLPHGGGCVYHLKTQKDSGAREFADKAFQQLCSSDLKLSRATFKRHIVPGFLSNQYMVNLGAEYRFAAKAPQQDIATVDPNTRKIARLLDGLFPGAGFNEMLILGYFDGQRMNFHSDDEPGVGPAIATMSLGATATMEFRLKENPKISLPNVCVRIQRPVSIFPI